MIILAILSIGCLWSIRAPWIGAIMWTVVSLGSPHIHFGYAAAGWPVSMVVGGATLVGLVLTRRRENPFSNGAVLATGLLTLWMAITYPFSLEPDLGFGAFDRAMKIMVMLFVTISLLDTREKLDVFIWANVASIGYYGVKGGVFSIMTGGNHIILGDGGVISENNSLALAEIIILPLLRYLQLQQQQNKWLRRACGASMALITISIIVSHSRGALLGLIAMAIYFWLKNPNKVRWALIIGVVAMLFLVGMPDEYWARMNTINSYEQDESAQGRINSWWVAYNIANDRISGAGFAVNVGWIFAKYAPNPRLLFVAHSIYFQMLGEQGYIGLFLFLSVGVLSWFNAQRMIKLGKSDPDMRWAAQLGAMVQVSLIGYAVSGAFLSQALFDLPYNVMAMSALGLRFARQSKTLRTSVAAPSQQGPAPQQGLLR